MTIPAPHLGIPVPDWTPPPRPDGAVLEGAYVRLERMVPERHATELFRAYEGHDALWTWLPYGPFASAGDYRRWAEASACGTDPLFYVLRDLRTGLCSGVASFLRIAPEAGSIEVGHICLSPAIARSPAVTEAMALMMAQAFNAGYRRYEWKCDTLNLASRRAAQRLGFSFEGIFRQALVVKGRNRDTAWFSVIDGEWPALRAAFDAWLGPENFDTAGRQRKRLSDLTAPLVATKDPAL